MRPRVGVLGFFHESNTFAATRVTEEDVRHAELYGEDIRAAHAGASTVVAGYLDAAAELDWETVPLVYCELVPCGPLEPSARARVRDLLLAELRNQAPFDAVLLCLHGAAVSLDEHDLDGYLLAAIRAEVGRDTLIAVTLDLHANVTDRIVDEADLVVGYRTNPHVDARDRAMEATDVVASCLRDGWRPVTSDVPIPATIGILAQGTGQAPMAPLMAGVDDAVRTEGVVTASLFQGFPWSDTADVGMRAVVATRDERTLGDRLATSLARQAWAAREEFVPAAPDAAQAFATLGAGTTLLLDVGDNIGGGAPGTTTHLLSAAISAGEASTLAIVNDPAAAEQAVSAGTGAELELTIGQPALRVRARVGATSDGRYEDAGPTHVGHRFFDAGTSAVLELTSGQHVVLCSRAVMPSSIQQLVSLGLHPADFRAVCAKGVHSPLASYGPHVDHTLFVDTPGVTSNDVTRLPYRHRPVPLFPLDDFPTEPTLVPRRPAP